MSDSIFEGNLIKIDPKAILEETGDKNLENFFLTLAIVYNDFKGLVFFETNLINNFKKPDPQVPTAHLGEYGGLLVQLHKLFVGSIREFLKFIKSNSDVLKTESFKKILQGTSPDTQKHWRSLVDSAFGNKLTESDLSAVMEKIRHSVAFHYWDAGKNLRSGFVSRFLTPERNFLNDAAYCSVEDKIDSTRFYYADAAEEQYIFSLSHNISENGQKNILSINEDYKRKVREAIADILTTLLKLLKTYLKNKAKIS